MASPAGSTAFAAAYRQAREAFLAAASEAGCPVRAHQHPCAGPQGELLAVDECLQGKPASPELLVVSSGCHGVEGHAGSVVQASLLRDDEWREAVCEAGVEVLYLHALNPWGFAHDRRVTHENIDLNRNFVDFSRPLPFNADYARLQPLLVPASWPPGWRNRLAIYGHVLRHGMASMQAAVSGGQYHDPSGLFYGGQGPSWSQQVLRSAFREHGAGRRRIAWIDLHTGLGRRGHGEKILHCPLSQAPLARSWWGGDVTVPEEGTSSSAVTAGPTWHAVVQECPGVEFAGIVLEFGTVSRTRVFEALRGDQWAALHPQAPAPRREAVRLAMREAFLVDTPQWRGAVLRQSKAAALQALRGLSSR